MSETGANKKVVILTIVGLLAGFLLSPVLWFEGGAREYPRAPLFALTSPFELLEPALSVGVCISFLLLLTRFARSSAVMALALAATLVCLDQSRLQPWFYQYMIIALVSGWCTRDRKPASLLAAIRFMLAAIYLWAGICKASATYFLYVFPAVFKPFVEPLIDYPLLLVLFAGLGPVLEVWIGLCFLMAKNVRIAAITAIALHATILVAIGPLGTNHNSVVWPWNLIMVLLVAQVFLKEELSGRPLSVLLKQRPKLAALLVTLFICLPVLNRAGLWDHYLSFSLYSGRIPEGTFLFQGKNAGQLREHFHGEGTVRGKWHYSVNIHVWSYAAMNVPAYPQERVYRSVFNSVCSRFADSEYKLRFRYSTPSRFWYSDRTHTYWQCDR